MKHVKVFEQFINEETGKEVRPWKSLKAQRVELRDTLKAWKRNTSKIAVINLSNMGPMIPKEPIIVPGSEVGTKIADEVLITVLLKNPAPFAAKPEDPKVHYAAVTHKGTVSLWNRTISEETYNNLVKKYGNKMHPYDDVTAQYMMDVYNQINDFFKARIGKHEW
jgi:hypothetical protein